MGLLHVQAIADGPISYLNPLLQMEIDVTSSKLAMDTKHFLGISMLRFFFEHIFWEAHEDYSLVICCIAIEHHHL